MMHVQGYLFFVFIAAIFVVVALLKLPCTSQHVHDETHLSLKNAWLQPVSFLDFNNVT